MSAFEQLAGRDPDRSFSNGLGQRGDHLPARSAKRSNNTLSNTSASSADSTVSSDLFVRFDAELHKIFGQATVSVNQTTYVLERAGSSLARTKALISLENELAQSAVDALQTWLDQAKNHALRPKAIYCLVKLAVHSSALPASLFIKGITLEAVHPESMGGFADVYKGELNGQSVALKRLRINATKTERARIYQQFCREALVWRQLGHANILTFIGIDSDTFREIDALCMIAPWMEKGNLLEYLEVVGPVVEVRNRMLTESAAGVDYLHSQNIIHGDIRASNIFVDVQHHARLADFGLVSLGGDSAATRLFTTTKEAGSIRYMAPELHDPERYGETEFRRTRASDVYAYGGLCYEVYTGKSPFSDVKSDFTVMQQILAGRRIPFPTADQCGGVTMSYGLYSLTLRCLEPMASARPSTGDILDFWGADACPNDNLAPLIKSPEHSILHVQKMLVDRPDLLERLEGILRLPGDAPRHLHTVHAIRLVEELLSRQPPTHSSRSRTQCSLGNLLVERFIQTGDLALLDNAMHNLTEVLRLTPLGNPERFACHIGLSRALRQRGTDYFNITASLAHLTQAIGLPTSFPAEAVSTVTHHLAETETLLGVVLTDGQQLQTHSALINIYKQVSRSLRKVISYDLDVQSRLRRLLGKDMLALMGSSHALSLSKLVIALQLLEEGRGIFWSQAWSLRYPHDADALPAYMNEVLTSHLIKLENLSYAHPEGPPTRDGPTTRGALDFSRAQGQVIIVNDLIHQINALPGLEHFSLLPSISTLVNATARGPTPVIVLLSDGYLCRAILISPSVGDVASFPLSSLTPSHLQSLAERIDKGGLTEGATRALADIWHLIVQPVVKALDLQSSRSSQGYRRPRVHWCPTGWFSYLPLHAAGDSELAYCTDYMVSSYTPSLHALMQSRKNAQIVNRDDIRALVVAQSTAPGFEPVHSVEREVRGIAQLLSPYISQEELDNVSQPVTVEYLLGHLPGTNVFHVISHGMQSFDEPLNSGVYLHDGLLSIANLMKMRMQPSFLAFLDADHTAKPHKDYPEQMINLCTAALFAGYSNVVGLLWIAYSSELGDSLAECMYEELVKHDKLSSDCVARALDVAFQLIRKHNPDHASEWASYVHIGA